MSPIFGGWPVHVHGHSGRSRITCYSLPTAFISAAFIFAAFDACSSTSPQYHGNRGMNHRNHRLQVTKQDGYHRGKQQQASNRLLRGLLEFAAGTKEGRLPLLLLLQDCCCQPSCTNKGVCIKFVQTQFVV